MTGRSFTGTLRALMLGAALAVSAAAPLALEAQETPNDAQAAQTVSRADIIRLLGRLHEDGAVRADLTRLGFAGEKLELATRHAADMLRDPIIAGYVADRVLAVRDGTAVPVGRAQGLLWGVIDRGLGHLPLRDLRYYYLVEQAVLGGMPEQTCGRAVRGDLTPDQMAEATARAAARLNTEGLRNYYRIQLRAAQLGAQRGPRVLPPERAARAEAAIFGVVTRTIAAREDAARMMGSFANLDRASARDACRAGQVFIEAVLTLEGQELNDALIQLSTP
ncbi:hypothetical protein [Roseovarius aquimarinus]|uniref:Uncharacterized protein n=1 Tax=Roseovarius aquimarinus TaxID=1229156 RepID=A0ABW7I7W0_9RHOB